VKLSNDKDFLEQVLKDLYKREILSLIVEGGRFTLDRFIEKELWDEARVIRGTPFFKNGIKAPDLNRIPIVSEILGGDYIDYYLCR
jgi:diaminohydroxyphosphoribosylaminopyrimidine deaminase/5-amino-6-(5-phosphoribosylamino)uracil reductase